METLNRNYSFSPASLGSYPTYEEWKLSIIKFSFTLFLSSYPTYEEWKQKLMKIDKKTK